MRKIPGNTTLDSSIAMALDPYRYISKKCRKHNSDVFQTRLMLRPTICMMGREAAELFYDPQRFIRHGAPPGRIQKTLFGRGGVQGLDDAAHRHRKEMFLSFMSPEQIDELAGRVVACWQGALANWAEKDRLVLYDELHPILTQAVCAWAGVPLPEADVRRRAEGLVALFNFAGSVGPKHWMARLARRRSNKWMEDIVNQIRAGQIKLPEQSPAYVIAMHRNLDGELLSGHIAAVELLNVLRPVVAVSAYIVLAAHALRQRPECRTKLAADFSYVEQFVQEVRRFYPFFPAVAAVVRSDFQWKGFRFPKGAHVMLDIYGVNHDPNQWREPERFLPERFLQWDESPHNFIPQGGGDHQTNHRCPGEWITIAIMKEAAMFLVDQIAYDVPEQDLTIDYFHLPALPQSRFVISNVRRAHVD